MNDEKPKSGSSPGAISARWEQESSAIRAIQMAFDISGEAQLAIKQAALTHHLNPPDQIRRILGLPYNHKPVRPRLTVTLRPEDFVLLAARYGIDAQDQVAIREHVTQELVAFARRQKAAQPSRDKDDAPD
jgi:hypothetical protein